ncbi:hypothetical protein K525DRAFT_212891, partial [Schizophyllum commune Loenen D]
MHDQAKALQHKGKGRAPDSPVTRSERRASPKPGSKAAYAINRNAAIDVPTFEAVKEDAPIFHAPKYASHPAGYSALDSRSLQCKVSVGSPEAVEISGRLDSGADLTLMSEDYFNTVPDLPKPKEGMRMKLYHLTGEASILGYTRFPMYATTETGERVCFDVEAYVVRGMTVPLLLGEDFHTAYELSVQRYANGTSTIRVGRSGRIIAASSSRRVSVGFSVFKKDDSQSFVRNTARKRAKALARRGKVADVPVYAAEEYIVQPGSVHNIRIDAPLDGRDEWVIDRLAIGTEDGSVMAAPLTLVNSTDPYIPMANPGVRPHYIRKGDV